VVGSDSLADSIEEELLFGNSLSPSSEINVVGSMDFSDSLHWKSGSEVEWSVDVESEIFMKSLSLDTLCLINIDDLPFLVLSIVFLPGKDFTSFFISIMINVKYFMINNVDEVFLFIFEELEPL
jgi:hypothetical protein